MNKPSIQTLSQAAICLLCAIVALKLALGFDDPESHGGALTGPLLDLNEIGFFLLLFTLVLTFINPRRAAICALIGSLLNLPLYLYVITPGSFYRILPFYTFRRHPPANFVWDEWAFAGILLLAILAYVCLRSFSAARMKSASGV